MKCLPLYSSCTTIMLPNLIPIVWVLKLLFVDTHLQNNIKKSSLHNRFLRKYLIGTNGLCHGTFCVGGWYFQYVTDSCKACRFLCRQWLYYVICSCTEWKYVYKVMCRWTIVNYSWTCNKTWEFCTLLYV